LFLASERPCRFNLYDNQTDTLIGAVTDFIDAEIIPPPIFLRWNWLESYITFNRENIDQYCPIPPALREGPV
jgi:hypothetical protein